MTPTPARTSRASRPLPTSADLPMEHSKFHDLPLKWTVSTVCLAYRKPKETSIKLAKRPVNAKRNLSKCTYSYAEARTPCPHLWETFFSLPVHMTQVRPQEIQQSCHRRYWPPYMCVMPLSTTSSSSSKTAMGSFLSHSGSEFWGLSYGGGLLYNSHPLGLQTQERAHPPRFWQWADVAPDTEYFGWGKACSPPISSHSTPVLQILAKLPKDRVCQVSVLQLPLCSRWPQRMTMKGLPRACQKGMDHVVVDRSAILHRHRVEPSCRLASSHCSLSQSGPSHFDAEVSAK